MIHCFFFLYHNISLYLLTYKSQFCTGMPLLVCMPHSCFCPPCISVVCAQRPERSSSPGCTCLVHGSQPMDGKPFSTSGCCGSLRFLNSSFTISFDHRPIGFIRKRPFSSSSIFSSSERGPVW